MCIVVKNAKNFEVKISVLPIDKPPFWLRLRIVISIVISKSKCFSEYPKISTCLNESLELPHPPLHPPQCKPWKREYSPGVLDPVSLWAILIVYSMDIELIHYPGQKLLGSEYSSENRNRLAEERSDTHGLEVKGGVCQTLWWSRMERGTFQDFANFESLFWDVVNRVCASESGWFTGACIIKKPQNMGDMHSIVLYAVRSLALKALKRRGFEFQLVCLVQGS